LVSVASSSSNSWCASDIGAARIQRDRTAPRLPILRGSSKQML
jgi:hypothetical protein